MADAPPTQFDKFGAILKGKGGDTIGVRRVGKRGGAFEALTVIDGQQPGEPARSIEGWVLFVSGLSAETKEEDLANLFAPYGEVRKLIMNLATRTSCCIGHAFIEFSTVEECLRAVGECSGKPFLSSPAIIVTNAFVVPEPTPEQDEMNDDDSSVVAIKRER